MNIRSHCFTCTTGKTVHWWESDAIFSPWQLQKEFPYMIIRYHFFTLTPGKRLPLHDHQMLFFHPDKKKKSSLTWSLDALFSPWQLEKELPYMIIRCYFFTLTNEKRVLLHDHQMPFFHPDNWKKSSLSWSSDAFFSPTTGKRVPFDDHHEPLFYLGNWKNNSFVIITSHFFTLTTRKRVLLHDHQIPLFHTGNWKKISLTWSADSIFSPCQLEKQSPYIIIRCHFFT